MGGYRADDSRVTRGPLGQGAWLGLLFKLFPGLLAPFECRTKFESFEGAMYVGLSPLALAAAYFPTRRIACL
jgi:hypothetical protein